MEEIENKLIEILVEKKVIMERYLKKPLSHTNKIFYIISDYDIKKDGFLKKCVQIDFDYALKRYKDFILSTIQDVVYYYGNEIKNCHMREISETLEEKHKDIIKTWETIERRIS